MPRNRCQKQHSYARSYGYPCHFNLLSQNILEMLTQDPATAAFETMPLPKSISDKATLLFVIAAPVTVWETL